MIDNLKETLLQVGVQLKELSLQELFSKTGQNKNYVFSALSDTIATVISLCRNRNYTASDLINLCKSEMPGQMVLAELTAPVLKDYEMYLRDNGLVNFTDMLNHAREKHFILCQGADRSIC